MYCYNNQPIKNVCILFGSIHFSKAPSLAPRWWGLGKVQLLLQILGISLNTNSPTYKHTTNLFYETKLKQKIKIKIKSNLLCITSETYQSEIHKLGKLINARGESQNLTEQKKKPAFGSFRVKRKLKKSEPLCKR